MLRSLFVCALLILGPGGGLYAELGLNWSSEIELVEATYPDISHAPRIAMNASGNAMAVWTFNANAASSDTIQASYRPAGGSFGTPANLSLGTSTSLPQVAIDSSNNAIAVWERSDGSNTRIQAAYFTGSTTTWGTAETLSAAGQNAISSFVAFDSSGNAFAVWQRSNGSNTIIQASYRPASTGVWGTPEDLSAAGASATFASVAFDSSGNAIAVWVRSSTAQAAFFTAGGSWGAPEDLGVASSLRAPQIAFDSNDQAIAVWVSTTTTTILAAVRPSGGSWSAETLASGLSGTPSFAITGYGLDTDSLGNAIFIWRLATGIFTSLRSSSGWASAQTVATSGNDPSVSFDANNRAVASWVAGSSTIFASIRPQGGSWGTAGTVFGGGSSSDTPLMVANGTTEAVVVWPFDPYGGSADFIYASVATADPPPVTGLSGSQILDRFPFVSEYFNQINWIGATTGTVVGYRIYRNGALIAVVPGGQHFYRDPNRSRGVATTYAVTSIQSDDTESSSVSVVVP